jgi:pantetheine-phosphate adenylyltransferase
MTIAVYAGTFDPITNGHLDVAVRAARLFEKVFVGVYDSPVSKRLLFTTEERVAMAKEATRDDRNIEVVPFTGLVVDFAVKVKAQTIVRGLRMSSDFEREFEMALMNKKLRPDLELVCLMSNLQYQFLSSSLLKEVVSLGGDIDSLVPKHVAKALRERLAGKKFTEN